MNKLTTKEKAVKIIEELITLQEKEKITFEEAGKKVKSCYNLTDKEFCGMLILAMI